MKRYLIIGCVILGFYTASSVAVRCACIRIIFNEYSYEPANNETRNLVTVYSKYQNRYLNDVIMGYTRPLRYIEFRYNSRLLPLNSLQAVDMREHFFQLAPEIRKIVTLAVTDHPNNIISYYQDNDDVHQFITSQKIK